MIKLNYAIRHFTIPSRFSKMMYGGANYYGQVEEDATDRIINVTRS